MTPPPDTNRAFRWSEARRFVHEFYLRRAQAHEREGLDDLVQEACVRTLRAMRRSPAEKPWALLNTIAQRTWIDHQRRSIVERKRYTDVERVPDQSEAFADPFESDLGDVRDRIVLIAHELFARRGHTACQILLRAFVRCLDWRQLAQKEGVTHAAMRKRWSRCLELLRDEAARDPALAQLLE